MSTTADPLTHVFPPSVVRELPPAPSDVGNGRSSTLRALGHGAASVLAPVLRGLVEHAEFSSAAGEPRVAVAVSYPLDRGAARLGLGGLDLRVGLKVYRRYVSTKMRISQLAARTGIPATTLRFYETAGLLPAERTPAGYRIYGEGAVDRLAFIGTAKQLGLALEEIAELLGVWESGACSEVRADLRPRIAARIADSEGRMAELASFNTVLRRALARLDALPDRSDPCDPRCGFLAAGDDTHSDLALLAEADAERQRTAPVACSLNGEDITERAGKWQQLLSGAQHEEFDNGVRLSVPAERTAQIAMLAVAEQRCCPFFDFRLRLDGPVLRLEVRAPAEGSDLLTELFIPTV